MAPFTRVSETGAARCRFVAAAVALALFFLQGGVVAAAPSTVTSISGAFETILPRGFTDETAKFSGSAIKVDLVIAGPKAGGFAVNITVVRERAATTSLDALVKASIFSIKHLTRAHNFSAIRSLTIAGAPARAFGYFNEYGTIVVHQRQVYAIHDGWEYAITYSALPGTQYRGSRSALRAVTNGWRWR